MPRWRILDGMTRRDSGAYEELELWVATLELVDDPAQHRCIGVEIARSVRQSTPKLAEVREALETDGYTAIKRFLNCDVPPETLIVSETAIQAKSQ